MAFSFDRKKSGDVIQASEWNELMTEIENRVLRNGGDTMTGPLTVVGNLKSRSLSFVDQNNNNFPDGWMGMADNIDGATKWLHIGGITDAGARRLTLFADRTYISGALGIQTNNPGAALDVNGSARVNDLAFKGNGNSMSIYRNDTEMTLNMGFRGLTITPGQSFSYLFQVGNTYEFILTNPFRVVRGFSRAFSVNQAGDITASGSKAGYVADFFINKVGDILEEGDVVIIGEKDVNHYYGTYNNIPIPEVDLTSRAYDTRVCGIVAKVVAESDLPPAGFNLPNPQELKITQARLESALAKATTDEQEAPNPLKGRGAALTEDFDHRQVQPDQVGHMVTLGAFAHCKVDADIAAIRPGDLLTSSPTKGHAQKVLDSNRATGAIIGKALSGLERGRGKIPVMVFMQ